MALTAAVTWNGNTHQPAMLEEMVGYERPLQSLEAENNFAYCLRNYPSTEDFAHPESLYN